MGIIAATIANANRSKSSKPYKAEDFMPFIDKPDSGPQTIEQQKMILSKFMKPKVK